MLSKPSTLLRLYDVEGALGGPIKKDKLWFFYLGRTYGSSTSVTGMFANKNAGNPNVVDRTCRTRRSRRAATARRS